MDFQRQNMPRRVRILPVSARYNSSEETEGRYTGKHTFVIEGEGFLQVSLSDETLQMPVNGNGPFGAHSLKQRLNTWSATAL